MVGGDWQTFSLTKDDASSDRDLLRLKTTDSIKIDGYVPHELMALAFVVEYEIGLPVQQRTQNNAQSIIQSATASGKSTMTVSLGVAVYIPFDGEGVIMSNSGAGKSPRDLEDREREFDDLAVFTSLRGNDSWKILAPKAVLADLRGKSDLQDDFGQPKKSGRRVSRGRKSSDGRSDDDDDQDRDDDDDTVADDEEGLAAGVQDVVTVGFDLAIKDALSRRLIFQDYWVPGTGADLQRRSRDDDADDIDSLGSERDGRKRVALRPVIRESLDTPRDDDARERRKRFSVAEAIVGGDSESCNLLLDPRLYSSRYRGSSGNGGSRGGGDLSGRSAGSYDDSSSAADAQFSIPRDVNSLLAQSLQAKLMDRGGVGSGGVGVAYEAMDDYPSQYRDRDRYERPEAVAHGDGRHRAQTSVVHMQGETVTSRPSTAPVSHTRNLSRASRTRLSSHGFDGALMDSHSHSHSHSHGHSHGHVRDKAYSGGSIHVDVDMEATDALSLHDVTIQLAGYRAGHASDGADSDSPTAHPSPRSVYFSYQFYSCQATRTEVMRLLPAERGGVSVLCRAEASARDEAPLALRHLVDCSDGSPTEAFEFAEYLARSALFVDVWDGDSLMLIGTCSIPLRRIMRQGQSTVRSAIECDIVDADANARVVGGVATSVITEGSAVSGTIVGAVHLILTNRGEKGRKTEGGHRSSSARAPRDVSLPGLNWRAHDDAGRPALPGVGAYGAAVESKLSRSRPRISVRARPLSENSPELSKALDDHRVGDDDDRSRGGGSGASMRSLTASRGTDGARTLTYDDVATLFKRFQGEVKGTVQYSGALMTLLDVPSWTAAVRKLIKAYKLVGGEKGFERVSATNELCSLIAVSLI